VKNQGIDKLLESITLESEMLELKASSEQSPRGTVIEAQVEQGAARRDDHRQDGHAQSRQPFICGKFHGKVKSLMTTSASR
jgi:translation initiation factor IF-2